MSRAAHSNKPGLRCLAWIILRSFPGHGMSVALFDKLQLRSALAEIFSSLGMEGEKMWRAAAHVRLLLQQFETSPGSGIYTEAFWEDPDVRWLTGVNTAAGITYFGKEGFEELLTWLQLPGPGRNCAAGFVAVAHDERGRSRRREGLPRRTHRWLPAQDLSRPAGSRIHRKAASASAAVDLAPLATPPDPFQTSTIGQQKAPRLRGFCRRFD